MKQLLPKLIKFFTTGVLSVGMDVAVLALLRERAHLPLWQAVSLAYFSSLIVNYIFNHNWVFGSEGEHHKRVFRYGCLVVVNYATTLSIVTGVSHLGAYYLAAKAVAVAVNAVINFTGFRLWVFKTTPLRELAEVG